MHVHVSLVFCYMFFLVSIFSCMSIYPFSYAMDIGLSILLEILSIVLTWILYKQVKCTPNNLIGCVLANHGCSSRNC